MDFKQLVMNEVDTKYQEMDKGTIASPLSKNPVVSSNSTYEKKREEYYKRLSREHSEFNKAVSKIINNRDARIKSENEERRIREEKRSKRRASTKKFFKTILVLAIIIGLAFALWKFILWPKVIYPKLDADSLYTPEILQSYCQSSGGRDEIFTFTECSESGQVSATWEIYSSNEAWLIKLTGRITEKKNSGDITIKWSSNEVVYKPSSGSWSREVTATISDNYETLKTDSDVFSAGTNDKNIISTAEDFKKLTNSEGTYFLKNDIDLSGKNWTPITGFKGTLIGNGHKISNLRIKLSSSNVGFFSTLEGTVRDVTFENANINVQGSYENVGILCGTLKGHISGIKVSGTVAAPSSMRVGGIVGFYDRSSKSIAFSDLENAAKVTGKRIVGGVFGLFANTYGSSSAMTRLDRFTNSGAIYGTEDTVGGVVGYINASTVLQVSDFKNTGSVKGISTVGGIVGSVASTYDGSYIQNSSCSARIEGAAVVGCIAGDTRAAINNCTNKGSTLIANGSLLENGNKYAYVGGFAGKGYIANNCTNEVNINYTAGGSYVGGVIGYMQVNSKNITMTNLSNKAQVSGASYVGGIYGFLYNSYGSSSATTQLDKFTNSGAITGSGDYVGGTIGFINARCMLYMSDFKNTGSVKGVTNIGGIIGYAEGYSGSYIQNSSCSSSVEGDALIGCIAGSAISVSVNNCTNNGSTLKANGYLTVDGNKYAYVGGFAGKGYIANNCTNEVNINYTAGGSYVGGVIGYMQVDSKNITMTNLSNKAQVSGAFYVGGIYGYLYNSYGSSSATTQLDKFTNSGAITGSGDYVGGTIGFINARCMLYMSDFKNTGSVKGVTNIGGIIGYAEGYSGSYIQDSTTSTGAIIGVASSVEIK